MPLEPTRLFPFKRNLAVSPMSIPAGLSPVATQTIGSQGLMNAKVTTFKVSNPNPFWVWYRGWNGTAAQMPTILGLGHHLAPGAIDINTSQTPDWIAAVAVDELGAPLFAADGTTPLYNMSRARLVMLFGSGM